MFKSNQIRFLLAIKVIHGKQSMFNMQNALKSQFKRTTIMFKSERTRHLVELTALAPRARDLLTPVPRVLPSRRSFPDPDRSPMRFLPPLLAPVACFPRFLPSVPRSSLVRRHDPTQKSSLSRDPSLPEIPPSPQVFAFLSHTSTNFLTYNPTYYCRLRSQMFLSSANSTSAVPFSSSAPR